MIEAQAKIISRLNDDVKQFKNRALAAEAKVDLHKQSHEYYMMIQDACRDHETVRAAWDQFLLVVKMCTEDEVVGLTTSEYPDQLDLFEGAEA